MNDDTVFSYSYSAMANKEVEAIRKKYLPPKESKLDELKRLDHAVQSAGMVWALSFGTIGFLIFGLGMCLAMKGIGDSMVFGMLLGLVGIIVMASAYPVHRSVFEKEKEKYTPRILELVAELSGEDPTM